jgi:hypothetical protein
MTDVERFLREHRQLTRRYFLRMGAAGAAVAGLWPACGHGESRGPELDQAIARLEPFFTPLDQFRDVSRGKPLPHRLPEERKRQVGLTRDTWKLEVISDPANPAKLGTEFTKASGTALDFAGLVRLGEKTAVR